MKKICWICLWMAGMAPALAKHSDADTSGYTHRQYLIKEVFVLGNKITKTNIIFREMTLKKGEIFSDSLVDVVLEQDSMRIYNTNLFTEVEIQKLYSGENEMMIVVKVTERWYIFPSFIFRLADRNFNDWWFNQNHDLSRVNLGLHYWQHNFRGRREMLDLTFQLGFERKFAIDWHIPYIGKSQKHGLNLVFAYWESRNAGFQTADHVRQFVNAERLLKKGTKASLTYIFRNAYYDHHQFLTGFEHQWVDDTVTLLNPLYFGNRANQQRSLSISYRFIRDLRNNVNYPTQGHMIDLEAEKIGIGIFNDVDIFNLRLLYSRYFDLGKNYSLAFSISGLSSWPSNQAYVNFSGLGFDQRLVRGYEQDLIESRRYILYKSTLRKRLFKYTHDISSFISIRQFQKIPIALYVKIFYDAGYAENYPQREISTRLADTFLQGVGLGLDLVTLYDFVTRFEYSVNNDGRIRFALGIKADL